MKIFGDRLIVIGREKEKIILGIVLRIMSVVNILSLIQIINY